MPDILEIPSNEGTWHPEIFGDLRVKDRYGRWLPAKWFGRLVDARRHRALLLVERESYRSARTAARHKLLVRDYWQDWIRECQGGISEGWRRDVERIGAVYILPHIGSLRLTEVQSRDIGAVVEAARQLGRAPGMLRHVYNVMHKMFDDAVEHFEYLDSSPVIRRYCPKVPRAKRKFLHPAEAARLMRHVRGHFLEPAIMLGLLAGLRAGEIQSLTWADVDLVGAQIFIRSSYKRRMGKVEPFPKQKDHGQATIPRPLLEYLRAQRDGKEKTDFVAPGQHGRMLNYHLLFGGLKRLCAEAGVTVVSPHELRHSCTELWVFNGASKEDCGRQLNHANASTTERYMHRTSDRLTAIGEDFTLPTVDGERAKSPLRLVQAHQE